MSQPQPKPFLISKHAVLEAWERVKVNQGAAGIDEESIQDFERGVRQNSSFMLRAAGCRCEPRVG